MLITAAGNLKHERLVHLAEEVFGPLGGDLPTPAEPEPRTYAELNLKKRNLKQVHMFLGVPTYPVAHEKRYACYIMNTLLGSGMSSRLFQNIRERRGLAYAIFSELNLYHDTGCLAVYAGTAVESTAKVSSLILEEFRRLKDERVSEAELRRSKDHLKGSLMLGLESTSSRMANLARQELYFDRFYTLDELIEGVEQVTSEDIQNLAIDSFRTERLALTVLGRTDQIKIDREHLVC
jgi:predicted Zn-dependent peptidase